MGPEPWALGSTLLAII